MHTAVFFLASLPLALQAVPFAVSPESWSTRDIPPNYGEARQVTWLAISYQNYLSGSPHQLLQVGEVKKAKVKYVPDIGYKYYVAFTAEDTETTENLGLCTATVFFQEEKPRPAINVNCSNTKIQKQASDDDYNFYKLMKSQTIPITGKNIPDSYGHIEPELKPVWKLARLGCSYVIWDKTAKGHENYMQHIKSAKQVLRKDNLIAFDYDIFVYERPSEAMLSCSVHVIWIPGKQPKVDYNCADDSDDGSGNKTEDGSASLGNFK